MSGLLSMVRIATLTAGGQNLHAHRHRGPARDGLSAECPRSAVWRRAAERSFLAMRVSTIPDEHFGRQQRLRALSQGDMVWCVAELEARRAPTVCRSDSVRAACNSSAQKPRVSGRMSRAKSGRVDVPDDVGVERTLAAPRTARCSVILTGLSFALAHRWSRFGTAIPLRAAIRAASMVGVNPVSVSFVSAVTPSLVALRLLGRLAGSVRPSSRWRR